MYTTLKAFAKFCSPAQNSEYEHNTVILSKVGEHIKGAIRAANTESLELVVVPFLQEWMVR